MHKVNHNDIRAKYSQEKKWRDRTTDVWTYYILRPISFYITPLFVLFSIIIMALYKTHKEDQVS